MEESVESSSEVVVMFVDDDKSYLDSAQAAAGSRVRVLIADDVQDALRTIGSQRVDAVVSDLKMPRMSGVAFLEEVRDRSPDMALGLNTGYQLTVDDEQRLAKIGATPFSKGQQIAAVLDEMLGLSGTDSETQRLRWRVKELESQAARDGTLLDQLLADLRRQLEQIPDPQALHIYDGAESYSVADLMRDIGERNPRGRDFVGWWLEARQTLRDMGRVVK
jgi:DNA-binding NtrC family response regulator